MKKLLFYLFTIFTFSVNAQDLLLEVNVNKNPALTSEVIQIQFSINAKGDDFIPPSLSDFHILSGPASGFNQSYSNINGKKERKITTTISYTLQTKTEGEFTIGSASVKVEGKKYKSSPLKIKFVKDINNKSKEDKKTIFISSTASKKNVFIGEQFSIVYNLYIKEGVNIQKSEVTPTIFDNFWEDHIEINQKNRKTEIIDGIDYTVIKYKHSILTALAYGDLYIPSSEVKVTISERGKLKGYDIFNRPVYHQKITSETLRSRSFNINVKELPTPKPKYFYGSVGTDFSIKSEIDRTKLKSGEAINYEITLRGTGNINLAETFPLEFPDEFDVFDPNVTDKTFAGNKSVSGSKIFEYILIPRIKGNYKIPPFKYSYFDVNTEKYIEIKCGQYNITVEKEKTYDEVEDNNTKISEVEKDHNYQIKNLLYKKLSGKHYHNQSNGIDIIIALDISGSMLAQDLKPNRLDAAKNIAFDFIQKRKNDCIGLVVFSGESFTQCPLTTDHNTLINIFNDVQHGIVEDGTAIGDGIGTSINRLIDSDSKRKIIILLTDGVNTDGRISPITAANIAAIDSINIQIYTIGVGTKGMARSPVAIDFNGRFVYDDVEVKIDEIELIEVANKTGGKYFRATDNVDLQTIFNEINDIELGWTSVKEKNKTETVETKKSLSNFTKESIEQILRVLKKQEKKVQDKIIKKRKKIK